MTTTDYLILQALGDSQILEVVSPAIVAYNIGISREHVSRKLMEYSEKGIAERIEEGKYRITEKGRSILTDDPVIQ